MGPFPSNRYIGLIIPKWPPITSTQERLPRRGGYTDWSGTRLYPDGRRSKKAGDQTRAHRQLGPWLRRQPVPRIRFARKEADKTSNNISIPFFRAHRHSEPLTSLPRQQSLSLLPQHANKIRRSAKSRGSPAPIKIKKFIVEAQATARCS